MQGPLGTFSEVPRWGLRVNLLGGIVTKDECLAAAARCVKLAVQITDPARKLMLIDLAATWTWRADQAEKNSQTDLVYETPLPFEPSPSLKTN
jgi:hypothetical protein